MSTLKTNTIQAATGSNVSIASGNILQAPGHVLQVQSMTVTTSATTASGTTFTCLLYTSPSPRDVEETRMPSSA